MKTTRMILGGMFAALLTAGTGCAGQSSPATGGNASAAQTIGATGFWCDHFQYCSQNIMTVQFTVADISTDPTTQGNPQCTRTMMGATVQIYDPTASSWLDVGTVSGKNGFQVSIAPGTYQIKTSVGDVDDGQGNPLTSITVPDVPTVDGETHFMGVALHHRYAGACVTCDDLKNDPSKGCDGTENVYCDGNSNPFDTDVYESDRASSSQVCNYDGSAASCG